TRTKTPVTRVATLCGFNSPQYFSHAFREAIGTSPLEYRTSVLRLRGAPSAAPHKRANKSRPRRNA
ncbi:MAG TPA: AraC family transcriptional regulator, partial [Polyangiaceae bacterium]|nr:AraC family transcriptional regulator [Polyangiaceae bacterium]